jgi:alpha-methylacyl-CoA racemase
VYRTRDGRFLAVGALEDDFFAALARGLGLTEEDVADRGNPARWPALRARIAEVIATRSQAEWTAVFEGTDACVAPVLTLAEAPDDPANRARGAFVEVDGRLHPAPAPRFDRTPLRTPSAPPERAEPIDELIRAWA